MIANASENKWLLGNKYIARMFLGAGKGNFFVLQGIVLADIKEHWKKRRKKASVAKYDPE